MDGGGSWGKSGPDNKVEWPATAFQSSSTGLPKCWYEVSSRKQQKSADNQPPLSLCMYVYK